MSVGLAAVLGSVGLTTLATPALAAGAESIDTSPASPVVLSGAAVTLTWTITAPAGSTCVLGNAITSSVIDSQPCSTGDVSFTRATPGPVFLEVQDPDFSVDPVLSDPVDIVPPAPTVTGSPTSPFNDATPTWTFNVGGGATATCTLSYGASTVQTDASCTSPFTAANLTTSSTNGDAGDYVFAATQTVNTETSAASAPSTYDFETATPGTPTVVADSALGNGRHPGFTVTGLDSNATPTCTVTPSAGASVVGCGTTPKLDLTGADDGSYTLSVTQAFAGNVSAQGSDTYTLDTAAPGRPHVAAASGFGSDAHPAFTVTGIDPGAHVADCTVTGPSSASVGSCDTSMTLDLVGKQAGTYTVTADAVDGAGNASATDSATYEYLPAPPPAPTVTAPSATGTDLTPTFTVTDGEGASLSYDCSVAGLPASAVTSCGSTTKLDLTGAGEGAYTLSVTATDLLHQTSTAGTASYTVDISTPAPTVTMLIPASSPSTDTSPTFGFSDTESVDGPDTYSCVWKAPNGTTISSGSCASGDDFGTAGNGNGVYSLAVKAKDTLGNHATTTVTYTLEASAPPAPTVTVSGATIGPAGPITFAISDAENVADLTFACTLSGGTITNQPVTPCGAITTVNLTGAADATYTLSVLATDGLGHASPAGVGTYTVDQVAQAPTVSLTAPLMSPSSNASPTFLITDNELVGGPDAFSCTWSGPGIPLPVPAPCASGVSFTAASDGTYTLSVTAKDNPGNVSPAATATYQYDATAPGAPTITPLSPAGTSGSDKTPTFTVTNPGDVSPGGLTYSCTATNTTTSTAVAAGKIVCGPTTTLTLGPTGDGAYSLHITATDAAGNAGTSSATASYLLDTSAQPPTVTRATPATSPASATSATFTIGDNELVGGPDSFLCTWSGPGISSPSPAPCASGDSFPAATDGSYSLSVTATDGFGNVSGAATAGYTRDTGAQAPTVSLLSPSSSPAASSSPAFTIADNELIDGPDTFACTWSGPAIIAPAATPCASGDSFPASLDGTYTLSVTATDSLSHTSSAVTATYLRDSVAQAPTVTLATPPTSPGTSTSPTFTIADNELVDGPDTFSCTWSGPGIPSPSAAPCASGASFPAASDGTYTLSVTAADSILNVSSPSTASYTRDATPPGTPTVTRTSPATSPGTLTSPTFSVTNPGDTSPGGLTYTCSATYKPTPASAPITLPAADITCGSTTTLDLSSTGDARYTLSVTATDASGSSSITPGTAIYTLDGTTPGTPNVVLSSPAASPGKVTSPTFTVTNPGDTSPGGITYTCTASKTSVLPNLAVPAADITCGASTTLTLAALGDGDYALSVTATDKAGNVSVTAGTATYTLDSGVPATPTVSRISPASSPGQATSVTFSVTNPGDTSPGGLTYACSVTGKTVVPASAISCGATTTVDLSGPGRDGGYTLSVTATDAAGNSSATAGTASYTLDTTVPSTPSVTLSTPASSPNNVTSPSFAVTNPGDVSPGGLTYSCTVTETSVFPVVTVPASQVTCGATTTLDLSGPGNDGDYRLVVVATDQAGNVSASGGVGLYTLDTTNPPAPVIVSPGPSTRLPAFGITDADASTTLSCLMTSPKGLNVFGPATCPADGTFDTRGFGEGDYTLTVTATDPAGNHTATTVTWTRDVTPPLAPTVTAPTSPSNDVTPTFTIADTDLTAILSCVLTGPDSSGLTEYNGACPADGSFTIAGLDGVYTLTVTATDAAGNVQPTVATAAYTLDTTLPVAPSVTRTVPASSPGNVTLPKFTVSDLDNSPGGITYQCSVTGPTTVPAGAITCGTTTSVDLSGSGRDGTYTLSVTATDAAGNISWVSGSASYTLDTTAPPTPVLTLLSPISPGNLTTALFAVTDTDGSPGLTYNCSVAGPTAVPASAINCGMATSIDLAGAGRDGTYTLSATATDAAGNTSAVAGTATYTLDTLAPGIPIVQLATATRSSSKTPLWTWQFGPNDATPGDDTATCTVSGPAGWTSTTVGCAHHFKTLLGGGDGTYSLAVTLTDSAGNSATNAVPPTYRLDSTAPAGAQVTNKTPASGIGRTRHPVWTIDGPATSTFLCTLLSGGQHGSPVTSESTCNDPVSFSLAGLSDGLYTLRVVAVDAAGNHAFAAYGTYILMPAAPRVDPPKGTGSLAVWTVTGNSDDSFECTLMRAGSVVVASQRCGTHPTYDMSKRPAGTYTLSVVQIGAADTRSPAATASWSWSGHVGNNGDPGTPNQAGGPGPNGGGHHPKKGGGALDGLSGLVHHQIHNVVQNSGKSVSEHFPPIPHPTGVGSGVVSAVQNVVHSIGDAGGGTGFPLLLVGLVLIFLIAQNRIDRRDPKLALASIAADDMVEFQLPPSRRERP